MKFFLVAVLLIASAYAQQITFAGNWAVNETDFNCNVNCCCPEGTVTIIQDPSNSSAVQITPTSWSNNAICTELNRTSGTSASYPFPANIDVSTTPLAAVYNTQSEGFAVTFFNVTKYVVIKTIGAYLIIDDANIGDIDGSVCEVTLVKKVL